MQGDKKEKMSDWKPLYYSLGITFILGIILPLILIPFGATAEIGEEASGIFSKLSGIIENGIGIFGFSFNPVQLILGETGKNFISKNLLALGLLPEVLQMVIFIFIITGWVYTIIKLLPTT
jgi:hypothetical protein